MSTEGVLYIAFGRPHLMMALNSAQSFRTFNPGRGITILTNIALPPGSAIKEFNPSMDYWMTVGDVSAANRFYKTSAERYSPYDRTLLLDADTVVFGNLDIPFRLLEFADALIKLDPKGQNRPWQRDEPILDIARMGELPSWNSGVMFFGRSAASAELFSRWAAIFTARGLRFDQPALLEAVLLSSARVLALDERWNSPTGKFRRMGGEHGPTQILHYMSQIPNEVLQDVLAGEDALVKGGHLVASDESLNYLRSRTERNSTRAASASWNCAPAFVRRFRWGAFNRPKGGAI